MLIVGVVQAAIQSAGTDANDPLVIREFSWWRDHSYEALVRQSEMQMSPAWEEKDENPPLSARKAMAAGRQYVAQQFRGGVDWRLASVTLRPGVVRDRWYYVLQFEVPPETDPGSIITTERWEPFRVIVLMNGRVVPATLRVTPPK